MKIRIWITGGLGMIGYHLIQLLPHHFEIHVLDYASEEALMQKRLMAVRHKIHALHKINIQMSDTIFDKFTPDVIVHLAAQTGVRQSYMQPSHTLENNHFTHLSMLELVRKKPDILLLYASSSSVYGRSIDPHNETNRTLLPTSSYGLSKLMNEQVSELYWQQYGVRSIGFRFFTVYGELNRHDMLMYYLWNSCIHKTPVSLYRDGQMFRDFTYAGDVAHTLSSFIHSPPPDGHRLYNVGGAGSVSIAHILSVMEAQLNAKANVQLIPDTPSFDPIQTQCDNQKLMTLFPHLTWTPVSHGISRFLSNP